MPASRGLRLVSALVLAAEQIKLAIGAVLLLVTSTSAVGRGTGPGMGRSAALWVSALERDDRDALAVLHVRGRNARVDGD